eukprot:gene25753-31101_t
MYLPPHCTLFLGFILLKCIWAQSFNSVGRLIGGGASTANNVAPSDVLLSGNTSNLWILNNTQSSMHGYIFFTDTDRHRIRYLNTDTNLVVTFAGTGSPGSGGSGIAATSSALRNPEGVCGDRTRVYVIDTRNHCVRRVLLSSGIITTVVASCGSSNSGSATDAFLRPAGCVVDTTGNFLYVSDAGNCEVKRFNSAFDAGTVYGDGNCGFGTNANRLGRPNSLVFFGGTLYVPVYTYIKKVVPSNTGASIWAGSTNAGFTDASTLTGSTFTSVNGLWIDTGGNLYIADGLPGSAGRIRYISSAFTNVTTISGTATCSTQQTTDVTIGTACFREPSGIFGTTLPGGDFEVYVSENTGSLVRRIFTTAPTRAPTQLGPVTSGSSTVVELPLTDEEKALQASGKLVVPSISLTAGNSNSSGSNSSAATTGASSIAAGVVTSLVSADLSKAFEASSAFSDGSAATKAATLIGLFSALWGATVLVVLFFGWSWKQRNKKGEAGKLHGKGGVEQLQDVKQQVQESVDGLTTPGSASWRRASLLRLGNALRELRENAKKRLDIVKALAIEDGEGKEDNRALGVVTKDDPLVAMQQQRRTMLQSYLSSLFPSIFSSIGSAVSASAGSAAVAAPHISKSTAVVHPLPAPPASLSGDELEEDAEPLHLAATKVAEPRQPQPSSLTLAPLSPPSSPPARRSPKSFRRVPAAACDRQMLDAAVGVDIGTVDTDVNHKAEVAQSIEDRHQDSAATIEQLELAIAQQRAALQLHKAAKDSAHEPCRRFDESWCLDPDTGRFLRLTMQHTDGPTDLEDGAGAMAGADAPAAEEGQVLDLRLVVARDVQGAQDTAAQAERTVRRLGRELLEELEQREGKAGLAGTQQKEKRGALRFGESSQPLDTPRFLFASFPLASRLGGALLESQLVRRFHSTMPGPAAQPWAAQLRKWRRRQRDQQLRSRRGAGDGRLAWFLGWVRDLAGPAADEDSDDEEDERYNASLAKWGWLVAPLRYARLWLQVLSSGVLPLVARAPLTAQRLIMRLVEPIVLGGLAFFSLLLLRQPVLLAVTCILLSVWLLSLVWGHWQAVKRERAGRERERQNAAQRQNQDSNSAVAKNDDDDEDGGWWSSDSDLDLWSSDDEDEKGLSSVEEKEDGEEDKGDSGDEDKEDGKEGVESGEGGNGSGGEENLLSLDELLHFSDALDVVEPMARDASSGGGVDTDILGDGGSDASQLSFEKWIDRITKARAMAPSDSESDRSSEQGDAEVIAARPPSGEEDADEDFNAAGFLALLSSSSDED